MLYHHHQNLGYSSSARELDWPTLPLKPQIQFIKSLVFEAAFISSEALFIFLTAGCHSVVGVGVGCFQVAILLFPLKKKEPISYLARRGRHCILPRKAEGRETISVPDAIAKLWAQKRMATDFHLELVDLGCTPS